MSSDISPNIWGLIRPCVLSLLIVLNKEEYVGKFAMHSNVALPVIVPISASGFVDLLLQLGFDTKTKNNSKNQKKPQNSGKELRSCESQKTGGK